MIRILAAARNSELNVGLLPWGSRLMGALVQVLLGAATGACRVRARVITI
jgi:hypothetical protein